MRGETTKGAFFSCYGYIKPNRAPRERPLGNTRHAMTVEAYKTAREFLLGNRDDYATAYRDFR